MLPCPHDDCSSDVSLADLDGVDGGLAGGRNWASLLDNTDNFITDGAVTVVDLVLEDVDALDEEGARVVNDLSEHEGRFGRG